MKKKLLVCVMALAAVFAVTGCEKKDNNDKISKLLKCSLEEDNELETYLFTYTDDKLSEAQYSMGTKYSTESEAKKANEQDKKDSEPYKNYKGLSVSTVLNGNSTVNTMTFTISELDDTSKAFYNAIFEGLNDKSYEDTKKLFEGVNYKCE